MIVLAALVLYAPGTSVSGVVTDGTRNVADAVVWLTGTSRPSPLKASVEQKDMKFVPRILVVPTGSTVDFPNRDNLFHNVFAEYNAKKFDLGMYPRGQTRKVTFDKPGLVSVLCNVHSTMSAFIIVVDTPFYAKTNAKGEFRIDDIPEGAYTLEAWHESGKRVNQKLVVAKGMDPLRVKIGRG